MAVPIIYLILLSLSLGWSLFFKAGVWPSDWGVTLLLLGSLSLCYWITTHRIHRAPPLKIALRCLFMLYPCFLAFQLIRFPLWVVQLLSPVRAELTRALAAVIPALSGAPPSATPPASVLLLVTTLSCLLTFLLVRDLAWRFSANRWVTLVPLIVLGALESAIGLFQAVDAGSQGSTGTYTNHDHFSGLLEMILPLSLMYGLAILRCPHKRFEKLATPALKACLIWSLAVLLMLAITYSLSRAGFIVAIAVLASVVIAALISALPSRRHRWVVLGLIGVALTAVIVLIPPDQLITRFAELPSGNQLSGDARIYIWKETLPLIADYRWVGSGLGSFESVFYKQQAIRTPYLIQFAHNDYLQYLIELGVVGFVLLATLLGLIFIQICRPIGKTKNLQRSLLAIGCSGSFLAILLHSFVDFNMYVPANQMVLAWIAGVGYANAME